MVGQAGRNRKAPADQLPGMEDVINRPPAVRGHAFYCRYEPMLFHHPGDKVTSFRVKISGHDYVLARDVIYRRSKGLPNRRKFLIFGLSVEFVKRITVYRAHPERQLGNLTRLASAIPERFRDENPDGDNENPDAYLSLVCSVIVVKIVEWPCRSKGTSCSASTSRSACAMMLASRACQFLPLPPVGIPSRMFQVPARRTALMAASTGTVHRRVPCSRLDSSSRSDARCFPIPRCRRAERG